VAKTEGRRIEFRLFWMGGALVAAGTVLSSALLGWTRGVSFLAGGMLAALSLAWLWQGIKSLILHDRKSSRRHILAGFLLRLLLIPLALYVMIRLPFLSAPAAVVGFAVFHCSLFVEGIMEAFSTSEKHARAE
jgi:hypothetical protein